MDWTRLLKHLATPHMLSRRAFPPELCARIARAIAASEAHHQGELRFVVEGPMDLSDLWAGVTARQRAEELFSSLRVWDTAHNCGVLIYVQLVDHKVEVLADRGIAALVPAESWRAVCAVMEEAFRRRDFKGGSLSALEQASELLVRHFPAAESRTNELPDRPVLL